jgi:Rrf2 family protein
MSSPLHPLADAAGPAADSRRRQTGNIYQRNVIMQLTRAGEYAIMCVLYMAKHKKGMVISLDKIAKAMNIPKQFLFKIVQQLSRSGIMESYKGPKGGCRLMLAPEQISLLDVVEAIMGKILLDDCFLSFNSCGRKEECAGLPVWRKAKKQLRQTLREATFDKLVNSQNMGHWLPEPVCASG